MVDIARDGRPARGRCRSSPGVFHFAGLRYWTASLLPALVGTTLPFWLRPPGFSFRWLGAIEFLIATVLLHAGFSFLHARFEFKATTEWPESRLLGAAAVCLIAACLVGLHINTSLPLGNSVPSFIFIVYGLSTLFAGVLYVAPPFSFCRRAGGEVVVCESLGLLPVLGAYLVQAGDLTRTVYLVSLPLVVATALWVLTDELISRADDEKEGRQTLVILFGPRFSGRLVVLALSLLFYVTLLLAVFSSSLSPWALWIGISIGLVWKIVAMSWKDYSDPTRMQMAHSNAFRLHLAAGLIVAASSLVALVR